MDTLLLFYSVLILTGFAAVAIENLYFSNESYHNVHKE